MKNFELFIDNAALLSRRFGIVPLLYGSLGLEYLTGAHLEADDIDILIPRVFIAERWDEFKAALEGDGYVLTDEHEHTFTRGGVEYSYAYIEDLEPFAGIAYSDIGVREVGGVRFGLLTAEQYLRVYRRSSEDGYRINVRKKKDADKIALLERVCAMQRQIGFLLGNAGPSIKLRVKKEVLGDISPDEEDELRAEMHALGLDETVIR